jgi:hypothetical protein
VPEGILAKRTILTDPLDLQQPAVGFEAHFPQHQPLRGSMGDAPA